MRAFLWLLAGLGLFILVLWWLQPPAPEGGGGAAANYPWQVERLPDGGSRVFGLALGSDTLGDAQARFGPRMQIALFADPDGHMALEALYPELTLGGLTARIALSAQLPDARLEALRERAAREEVLDNGVRRYTLSRQDARSVLDAPLTALTYLPAADYDEALVRSRFGAPEEVVADAVEARHFLYPALGLDVTLEPGGKAVLQYVPPAAFERLRQPLVAPAGG